MRLPLFQSRSLAARLVLSAAIWSLVILLLGGFLLAEQYRRALLAGLDRELEIVVNDLVASIVPDDAGGVLLPSRPTDPRFGATYSGRYWQIATLAPDGGAAPALRSDSLFDADLAMPAGGQAAAPQGKLFRGEAGGPDRQRLRLVGVTLQVQGVDRPVLFLAAADRREAEADAARFALTLALSLAALAAGLITAVVLQVRVGLAPLKTLEADVADVRNGRRARLGDDYPTEVAPLTRELNKLLDHNREIVDRARTHVGNLAHALKTPISVLLNEARAQSEEAAFAGLVRRQGEAMAANVDHYLRRAQAAARAEAVGARTPIGPVIEDLARTLERLYGPRKDLEIALPEALGEAAFRGERQDFEEMVGNLMENACKYGGGRVEVDVAVVNGRLTVRVDDDGPGISQERKAAALTRGQRLDESQPGQGLGLSIVAETARLYGGDLKLEESPLGGVSARLDLPAAD
jgi:signal transduction histidine kinase